MRSALRTAPAAYWASWADALPMIDARTPPVAELAYRTLAAGAATAGSCMNELIQATELLDRRGYSARPAWADIRQGLRPPKPLKREAGEWPHGWQFFASFSLEHNFLTTSILPCQSKDAQAHLEEHSGPGAGTALSASPSAAEFVRAQLHSLDRLRPTVVLSPRELYQDASFEPEGIACVHH